jgi:hypothetical protein
MMLNAAKVLHREIMYPTQNVHKLKGYHLMTTELMKSSKPLKAYVYAIDRPRILTVSVAEMQKILDGGSVNGNVGNYDLITTLNGTIRLVSEQCLAIQLNTDKFKSDFREYMNAKKSKKQGGFWNKAFNIAATALLIGLGYKLLKRIVVGTEGNYEITEFWEKPENAIAMESSMFKHRKSVQRIQRKSYKSNSSNLFS